MLSADTIVALTAKHPKKVISRFIIQ